MRTTQDDGRAMVTVVPSPTALFRLKAPPCSSTSALAMRKAQAGPFKAPGKRVVQLPERLQRRGNGFLRHADTGVLDDQMHAAIRHGPGDKADLAAFGREFQGIGQKIAQRLGEAARIDLQRGHADRHVDLHRAPFAGGAARQLDGDLRHVQHILGAHLDGQKPTLDARNIQHVVDDRQKPGAAFVDVAGIVAIGRHPGRVPAPRRG